MLSAAQWRARVCSSRLHRRRYIDAATVVAVSKNRSDWIVLVEVAFSALKFYNHILINAAVDLIYGIDFKRCRALSPTVIPAIHLRAPSRLTQLLAPAMAKRGWGTYRRIASHEI